MSNAIEKEYTEINCNKEHIKKVKVILREWGNYHHLIAMEKNELESINKIYNNMNNIKSACSDIYKTDRANEKISSKKIEYNMGLCKSRLEIVNDRIKNVMLSKKKIDTIVDGLEYMERYILKERYINKQVWDTLPLRLPCVICKRQCQRIHNIALEKIYAELKKMGEIV